MKSRTRRCIVAAAALLLALNPPARAQSLAGAWITEDGSSRVRFFPCGRHECGRIDWLREPVDPATGRPWQDKFNASDALKRRSLLGLSILTDLRPTGDGQWEGELYNPLDGKSYSGVITLLGDGRMQLKGCAALGVFCQREVWTRAD